MTATTHRSSPGSASSARRPASDTLTGTGTMVRLVLRRNRVRLAVWWVVLVGLFAWASILVAQGQSTLDTIQKVVDVEKFYDRERYRPSFVWCGGYGMPRFLC